MSALDEQSHEQQSLVPELPVDSSMQATPLTEIPAPSPPVEVLTEGSAPQNQTAVPEPSLEMLIPEKLHLERPTAQTPPFAVTQFASPGLTGLLEDLHGFVIDFTGRSDAQNQSLSFDSLMSKEDGIAMDTLLSNIPMSNVRICAEKETPPVLNFDLMDLFPSVDNSPSKNNATVLTGNILTPNSASIFAPKREQKSDARKQVPNAEKSEKKILVEKSCDLHAAGEIALMQQVEEFSGETATHQKETEVKVLDVQVPRGELEERIKKEERGKSGEEKQTVGKKDLREKQGKPEVPNHYFLIALGISDDEAE